MSRYATISSAPDSPTSPTRSRRSSLHSIRSFRLNTSRRQHHAVPDPDEMDAAFDAPDDEAEGETHGLLGRDQRREGTMPGDYDFERDYTLPPPSPPPFQPYSSHNPAPGNTNGVLPSAPAYRPNPSPQRHFLGGILPSSFLPRHQPSTPGSRVVGGGASGVFGNLAARPDNAHGAETGPDGAEYAPEEVQKEGPPSYQAALRDAVPPYWDTTVVLPSSSSPFGPLSSSMSGDEILIDGMPGGNFFGFFWNLIVSFSFQFVGFLLTYVLHTTHAAKYGSRVGLGMTLIQVGLNLRSRAEDLINSGRFPTDPSDPPAPDGTPDESAAENAIEAIWGPGGPWPVPVREPGGGEDTPIVLLNNVQEAEDWAHRHNKTLSEFFDLPNAEEVGRANEYFSFLLMSVGWFIVLTSVGGWWRVKRFERGLRQAQRESEQAQAAANANRDNPNAATATSESSPDPDVISTSPTRSSAGPTSLVYYTSAFSQAFAGARDIQRGFFGMHGRPLGGGRGNGHAHAPISQDEGEHELLDAQGFGLGPMANDGSNYPGSAVREGQTHRAGLWGI
ncbi:hypothetical protein IAU59_006199 [Kwoniella sp. CBS 9459]